MEQATMDRNTVTAGEIDRARERIKSCQSEQAEAMETAIGRAAKEANRSGQTKAKLFRGMADKLGQKITDLRRPRPENTPKRQREVAGARLDAKNHERTQRALLALADGYEAGTVPAGLQDLRYQNEIDPLVRRLSDTSGGYYSIVESKEWARNTPQAEQLRAYVAEWEGKHYAQVDADRARADKLREMENAVRFSNIPGFFPTPPDVISSMLEEASIEPGMCVLEPSAGKGDIADAVRLLRPTARVSCVEINHTLTEILRCKGHTVSMCGDFIAEDPRPVYDRVLMNPPFENGQDMVHVIQAFDWLKPGGRLVAIVSAGAMQNTSKKAAAFQAWLHTAGATSYENAEDAFNTRDAFRQTGVRTWTLVIDKPE